MRTISHPPNAYLEKLSNEAPLPLSGAATDFTDKYYAVFHLRNMLEQRPELIDLKVISAIKELLMGRTFEHQHQGFFLFREAAETLASCMIHTAEEKLAVRSYDALKDVLGKASGHKHRAVSSALGTLPFRIEGPRIEPENVKHIPQINWSELLRQRCLELAKAPVFLGRNLVAEVKHEDRLLVLKLAKKDDSPVTLQREILWMRHLNQYHATFQKRFDIPQPIQVGGSNVLRITDLPVQNSIIDKLHPKSYAVGYMADLDYFCYPNEADVEKRLSTNEFIEVIFRSAWIAAKLSSLGIVHAALIPLFHNRTQSNRRQDNGIYEWVRAGRLDRWLYSCEYPNFGKTGVRDFEHLETFLGTNQKLYRAIGNHLLSLLLVAGSYFRQQNPLQIGYDEQADPVDVRDLFQADTLEELIRGIFHSYYEGFVGEIYCGDIPVDFDRLTSRMIDEMGVDRYMEEIFRVADQETMSEIEFRIFLAERGMRKSEIAGLEKGIEDIVIQNGPHLGGFNNTISLPELIEAIGTMSALCMAGRFWAEKYARWRISI